MQENLRAYAGTFPTTIWTEVEGAGPENDQAVQALAALIQRYYRPLRAHLEFKFWSQRDRAADWLHNFIHQRVLLGNLLKTASRQRGRFRTYLLNALDNFVISELRRENSTRRRPARGLVSFDQADDWPQATGIAPTTDRFLRDWALSVIDETLNRMRAECLAKNDAKRWALFKARRLDPELQGAKIPPYEELVQRLGFASPREASNADITARRQFERLLRQVIAEYSGEEQVEQELRELKRALTQRP